MVDTEVSSRTPSASSKTVHYAGFGQVRRSLTKTADTLGMPQHADPKMVVPKREPPGNLQRNLPIPSSADPI
jgi:hypothetical protein